MKKFRKSFVYIKILKRNLSLNQFIIVCIIIINVIIVPNKRKRRKKSTQEPPVTSAVDISFTSVSAQQSSNGSSISSSNGGDESSSVSSFDDCPLDNDTSSLGYTQEEQEDLTRLILEDDLNEYLNQQLFKRLLESVLSLASIQHQINLDDGGK